MLAERKLDMQNCKEYAIVRYFVKVFVPDFPCLFPICSRHREHLYPLQRIGLQSLFPIPAKSHGFLPKKTAARIVFKFLGICIFEREHRDFGNKCCKLLKRLGLSVPVFVPGPKLSGTPTIAYLLTRIGWSACWRVATEHRSRMVRVLSV